MVMEKFPFHKYKFLVLSVERPQQLRQILEQNEYVYVMDHGDFGDELYVHKSIPNFNEIIERYLSSRVHRTAKSLPDFSPTNILPNNLVVISRYKTCQRMPDKRKAICRTVEHLIDATPPHFRGSGQDGLSMHIAR